jgi:hypothetical protein
MASPPQVSPDGAYWWDGQAWQPTALGGAPTSVAQSVQETARPSWLPQGVELPSPSDPPDAPLTPAAIEAPAGAVFTPAVIGAPAAAVYTPAWAGETDAPDTSLPITKRVLVWAGLVVGGAILVFGLLGLAITLGQPASVERTDSLAGAAVLIVFGGAIFAPCLGVVLGFAPVVGASLHSLGIAGCLVVLGMVLNTALAVTTPLGAGRFVMPWGTVAVVVFRAWRGRWLGAGIIVITWAVGAAIILTMARS